MHAMADVRGMAFFVRSSHTNHPLKEEPQMPMFVIERNLPGAGSLSSDELHSVAAKSNEVLAGMDGRAQWQHSYVTDDKLFCVYVAEDADAVYEHAKCGGFPADAVLQVGTIIDRTTGE